MGGLFLSSSLAFAKDLGIHGAIYHIAETDLLKLIEGKLQAMDARGEIAAQQEQMKLNAVASMERPTAVQGLVRTTEERVFFFDPTMVLQEDLADQEGRVFATAGTRVNPFDYISLSNELLFIQGSDDEQVEWAFARQFFLDGHAKIIFVDGMPLEAMRIRKSLVYFDQNGHLTNFFGIRQVPAIVTQDGDNLKIQEVKP